MRDLRLAWSFAAVIAFTSVLAWAGKPWLDARSYTEWSEKDVRAILTESPWVASQTFLIYGREDETASRELNPQEAQGVAAGGNVGSGTDRIGQVQRTADSPLDHQIQVSVIWASSLTLRQATVRMSQLRGVAPQGDPAQYLSQQPQEYEIVVTETPWSESRMAKADLLSDLKEPDLKERAYLETIQGGRRTAPARVQIASGRAFSTLRFFFPRELEGKPLIPPGEERVRFFCKTRRGDLKAEFNLRAMVRDGKPDL
jgi:hypothetical protein